MGIGHEAVKNASASAHQSSIGVLGVGGTEDVCSV